MTKALVIFSGGQDSTTCLYWAMANFKEVEAITFAYNQRHAIELECANAICMKEGIKQKVIDLSFLPSIVDSALTSTDKIEMKNGLPTTYVPNRNQLFITLAHAYAQKIGAAVLITGVCQTDYSGYPDCRSTFIYMLEATTNAGSNSNIKILTPLMKLNKAQTFQMAADLGRLQDVISLTNTCYLGKRQELHEWGYGCGRCPACELRKKGYENYLKM